MRAPSQFAHWSARARTVSERKSILELEAAPSFVLNPPVSFRDRIKFAMYQRSPHLIRQSIQQLRSIGIKAHDRSDPSRRHAYHLLPCNIKTLVASVIWILHDLRLIASELTE